MAYEIIAKVAQPEGLLPMAAGWDAARARLDGLPGGGLNVAHEAVDRHVGAGHGAQTAMIWLGREAPSSATR
ncbi:hypothetical protein M3P36_01510 [Altererythrobacter sp. KTW20L]|uniref:hypothetical protein n=1 Tax=Altererythrobacter sp. KTW20L TaxID=2942210 RepID=UPI0020BE6538|nr:hypothetical protein [Altererythrobacter sp. KTW20L]MCL6249726.1 hypothetical protein [Altererythrobacter sp. KTW20L]